MVPSSVNNIGVFFFLFPEGCFRVRTTATWSVCHLATPICPTCKFSRNKEAINKRGISPWGPSCCIVSSMFKDREGTAVGPSGWHHKACSPHRSRLAPRGQLTARPHEEGLRHQEPSCASQQAPKAAMLPENSQGKLPRVVNTATVFSAGVSVLVNKRWCADLKQYLLLLSLAFLFFLYKL